MKLLSVSAIAVITSVLALSSADAGMPAGAGDPVVNLNNSTIVKLNAADGSVEWSMPVTNDGTLKIDPSDLSIYTSLDDPSRNETTVYRFSADGTVNWANSSLEQKSANTGAGAPPNYVSVCDSYTDVNPADGTVYRGGGDVTSGGCAPTISQTNKSNSAAINWSMDLSGYVRSVDALAVQPWEGGYLYAASASSSKIVVIDPAAQSVVTSFDTAIPPRHIAVNPNGGNVYVADGRNPFVISYKPTGALGWVNLNLGGAVSNIATPKEMVGVAAVSPCPVPVVRIFTDRNSIHKGETAVLSLDFGASSPPPCQNTTVFFYLKTHATGGTDYTLTDQFGNPPNGQTVGPLFLTNLYTSRTKTLQLNVVLLKDSAYYLGNHKVTIELLAN